MMKDSGIEWIKEVPSHWKVDTIGSLYALRNEKVSDKDFAPLSVTKNGILPQLETAAKTDDGDNRKLVRVGDFAINSRSDRRGSCGISEYDGSVSLINTIITPRVNMNPRYYNWLFHTESFADEFYKWGHGIVDDLWTTRWQEMKRIAIVVPTIEEQQSIAAFLDTKCLEIDELISLQDRIIEELKAYKQSIITEAVTKGLNRNVPMKDSGIEWIGEIPEHWKCTPFKSVYSLNKGLTITKADLVEKGIPVINYGQIHSKISNGTSIKDELIRFIPETYLFGNEESIVKKGDIIFADTSEDFEGCGNCLFVDKDYKLFAGYHTIIAKNKDRTVCNYNAYLFKTDCWRSQIRSSVNGVKVFSIPQRVLSSTEIVAPPFDEQTAIATYLDEKCSQIDNLISLKQTKIETLKSYKKSIIYEYVTGKKQISQ